MNRCARAAATLVLASGFALGAAEPPSSPSQGTRPRVGEPAPEVALTDIDGDAHVLSRLRGETAVVLVFYRGAW